MKYFKKCMGERVYLSPINAEDTEICTKWINSAEISVKLDMHWLNIGLETEAEWFSENESEHQYAIVSVEGDRLLGMCGLTEISPVHRTATAGIFIGETENRHKGYGSEALRLLLRYGFDTLNLHNIMLNVLSGNEAALGCYRKLGFKEIGRRREAEFADGRYNDRVLLDILRDELK